MDKKLIALDIDGTLTNSKKEVTPKTREKLTEAQEMGHIVAIASGRPLPGIKAIADAIELPKYGGYVLAFNGGRIVNCATGDVVYQKTLPCETVREIYDYCVNKGCGMVTYEDDVVITGTDTDSYMSMEARLNHMEMRKLDDFREHVTFPVNKCLITAEAEKAARIETELAGMLKGRATVFRSEPFFVEVMPMNIHKAASLEKLLELLGMTRKSLIACGDGYNDLTMIEYAGVGVAMENAQDSVKEHADYITLSNEADGLVPVIDKFVLGG